jgi:hypothetical protein
MSFWDDVRFAILFTVLAFCAPAALWGGILTADHIFCKTIKICEISK